MKSTINISAKDSLSLRIMSGRGQIGPITTLIKSDHSLLEVINRSLGSHNTIIIVVQGGTIEINISSLLESIMLHGDLFIIDFLHLLVLLHLVHIVDISKIDTIKTLHSLKVTLSSHFPDVSLESQIESMTCRIRDIYITISGVFTFVVDVEEDGMFGGIENGITMFEEMLMGKFGLLQVFVVGIQRVSNQEFDFLTHGINDSDNKEEVL
mmetsp:Transcript_30668/g.27863  ORF Transcript_30668/g.27863 Transcript_30668/m.27863 type:complete len:210 (-) Transcript_30668:935-1564(-)